MANAERIEPRKRTVQLPDGRLLTYYDFTECPQPSEDQRPPSGSAGENRPGGGRRV